MSKEASARIHQPRRLLQIGLALAVLLTSAAGAALAAADLKAWIPGQAQAGLAESGILLFHRGSEGTLVGLDRAQLARLSERGAQAVLTRPEETLYVVLLENASAASFEGGARVLWRGRHEVLVATGGRAPVLTEAAAASMRGLVQPVRIGTRPLPWSAPVVEPPSFPREADPIVQDMVDSITEATYVATWQTLDDFENRYAYHAQNNVATQWILEEFQSYGLSAEYHYFNDGGQRRNVIATLPGVVDPSRVVYITGHLDATSGPPNSCAPGADDNGSGTAAVLEAARVLSQYRFQYTVKFAAFNNEEQGLVGSAAYCNTIAGQGENVIAVFNADMISYRGTDPAPADLIIYTNNNSQPIATILEQAADTYVANLFKLVRTGDVDGDGRAEILIQRSDRIRTFTEPELSNAFVDTTGSFYTAGSVSNYPTMAVANLDGEGTPLGPTLTVTPGSLTFNLEYSQAVTPQTLRVENSGTSAAINWQAQVITASPWLLLSKTSGVTNDTLNVSVDTRAVGPGTYTGTIRFTSNTPGVVNATQDVQVTLNLTGVGMVVTPSRVSFEVEYGNTAEKTVSITSAGGSAQFNWQAVVIDGASWLSVSPVQGTSPSTMRVIVNATAAGPGVKQGTIRVSALDPNVANGVQYVTVDLNVPDPGFVVLPKQLTIFQERTGPTVTKQISIWRPGGSVNWVASAVDVPTAADVAALAADGKLVVTEQGLTVEGVDALPAWLNFSPSSGTTQPNTPSIMNVSVKPGTANGRYRAVITIVADDPTLANRIQTVEVTAIVLDDVKVLFLPLVVR